jgi:hypothetical protein
VEEGVIHSIAIVEDGRFILCMISMVIHLKFKCKSAERINPLPKRQPLRLIHPHLPCLIQPLNHPHILLKQLKIRNIKVIPQMIQLLSLRNHRHPTDNLIIQQKLRNTLRILIAELLENGLVEYVELIAEDDFLVFAAAGEWAGRAHYDFELFEEVEHFGAGEVAVGLDLVEDWGVFGEGEEVQEGLLGEVGDAD